MITIIVMLILVAVTVSVALNGGLFSKANDAARKTQIEIDREELQAALLDTMDNDGKVHLTDGTDNAGNTVYGVDHYLDKDRSDGEYWEPYGSTFTKHHKNGDINEFTVTINANGGFTVAYNEAGTTPTVAEAPEDLVKYVLGSDKTGRSVWDILNQYYQFQDDQETEDIDESTAITLIGGCDGETMASGYFYIRYSVDGNIYRVKILIPDNENLTTIMTAPISESEPIKLITTQDENVGKTATIDGKKYIVLYGVGEKGPNVQLITANTYRTNDGIRLGYNDTEIDWTDEDVIEEANIFPSLSGSNSVLTNVEKSIYSYNNVIEILNAKCSSIVGNTNSDILDVRCVGSNPTSKNSENNTMYTSTFLQNNPTSGTYSVGALNGKGKEGDLNFFDDYDRLVLIGALEPENSNRYWLASRIVAEFLSESNNQRMTVFGVRYVREGDDGYEASWLWTGYVDSQGAHEDNASSNVRPVITISPANLAKYLD